MPDHLRGAMSLTAAYLPQGGHREPLMYVPELSRRARGVDIWAALKSLGRSGLAELIDRNCRCAKRFADGLGGRGLRDSERRGAEPGAGVLRLSGNDRSA